MSWEARYQQQDTPWDKGAPAPPLLELLAQRHCDWGTGAVLVPGCGRGHDARALAHALPHNRIIGMDLAPTAISQAQALSAAETFPSLEFCEVDFLQSTRADYPDCGSIFEHTCFCAIDPALRGAYAEACARLLPIGGLWVAIIFLTPREEDDPTVGPPYQSSEPEIYSLFSPAFRLVQKYRPQQAYKGRHGKEIVMIWERVERVPV